MKFMLMVANSALMALSLQGCSDGAPANRNDADSDTAATKTAPASQGESSIAPSLKMPPSWMPGDWDRNAYRGAGDPLDEAGVQRARQNVLTTAPLVLWAAAHDPLTTEAFEPIWVWYTALRSCDRGIQLSEDLAGEFSNSERGKAQIAQARNELNAWAATQSPEMTVYFPAHLGRWDEASGAFQLQQTGTVTPLKPKELEFVGPYLDGATVQLGSDRSGQAINHIQVSISPLECSTKDRTKVYKFDRGANSQIVFGDVDRGMGGLALYKSRAMLPPISMTREKAADFAQRNPKREVEVTVTFVPVDSSFLVGSNISAVRAKLQHVTITDGLDNATLASKAY